MARLPVLAATVCLFAVTGAAAQSNRPEAPALPTPPPVPGMNGAPIVGPSLDPVPGDIDLQTFLTFDDQGRPASDIIGADVYDDESDDALRIGAITDVIIGSDGSVGAVLIDVGAFLGVGEKTVAVAYNSLEAMPEENDTANGEEPDESKPRFFVRSVSRDDLQSAPEYKSDAEELAAAPPSNPEDWVEAADLVGATVYDSGDQQVGEIGDVLLTTEGAFDAVVIDVGGFLGLGAKPVAIGFDSVEIARRGDEVFAYVPFTKEMLETAPKYVADDYAAQRETMRLSSAK